MNTNTENNLTTNTPLVIAASVGIGCSAMALTFYYSIGALTKPLGEAYDWSKSDVQTPILISIGVGALAVPLAGKAVERWGARKIALLGVFSVGISFFLAALAGSSLSMFYLAFLLMAILGSGSNPVSWTRSITLVIKRRLGLALAGTGVCAILAPQLTTWLVEHHGITTALIGLVPIFFCTATCCCFFHSSLYKHKINYA